eukprot:gene26541-57032_t
MPDREQLLGVLRAERGETQGLAPYNYLPTVRVLEVVDVIPISWRATPKPPLPEPVRDRIRETVTLAHAVPRACDGARTHIVCRACDGEALHLSALLLDKTAGSPTHGLPRFFIPWQQHHSLLVDEAKVDPATTIHPWRSDQSSGLTSGLKDPWCVTANSVHSVPSAVMPPCFTTALPKAPRGVDTARWREAQWRSCDLSGRGPKTRVELFEEWLQEQGRQHELLVAEKKKRGREEEQLLAIAERLQKEEQLRTRSLMARER